MIRMNDDGTFPRRVFHPIFGAKDVTDANELPKLSIDYFNTAEEADMHRTETEAQMVIHHNRDLKVADAKGTDSVVRNSVAAHLSKEAGNNEPL